ncbi:hypothetical protein RSAG8_13653, partial [Rhizoctonia solani AG-8 WAC10335]
MHDLDLRFDADDPHHDYTTDGLPIKRTEFITSLMSLDEVAHCLIRHGCTDISSDLDLRAAKELYIWTRTSHPGILKPLGFAQFRGQIALISPWMDNGSLRTYLARHLDANRVQLCIQAAQALEHLHSSGIVHGDMKPDNIMLSDDGRAQLADFGSAMLTEDFTLNFTKTTCKYTLRFAAPELLDDTSEHTTKTDIYALGMTILSIMTGKQPFYNKRDHAIMMAVTLKKVRPTRSEYSTFAGSKWANDRLWDLLERCWAHAPKYRPTAAELVEIERGAHVSSKQNPPRTWQDTLVAVIDVVFFLLFLCFLMA